MRATVTSELEADAAPATGADQLPGRLDELYVRHAPAATRLAYFLTGDRELAQDLVQEAFVRLFGRFRHLREPEAFEAYLRKTVVNLYTTHLRRLKLERANVEREERQPTALQHHDADVAVKDEVWRALQRLPERQRAAIVLRFYEDLSERGAADVLRCSTGALNQLVARAMTALRDDLGSEER